MQAVMLFLKSHVKGFTRKDGVFVPAHDNKVIPHKAPKALWAGAHSKAPLDPAAYEGAKAPDHAPPQPIKAKVQYKGEEKAPWNKPKITGAQFGGTTPGTEPKKKWHNSLIGKMSSKQFAGEDGHQHAFFFQPKHYPNAITHPQADDIGKPVKINEPDLPSSHETWEDPKAIAVFTPGSDVPDELNGVQLKEWKDAPTTEVGWHFVEGQKLDLEEPDFDAHGKKPAAGVIIQEPDGRIWLLNPTNGFAGYHTTFPKGRTEDGMSMQASAIKEAFEETGLKVEITGFLGDIERSQTMARYYMARRVGGTPKAMGWEAQAVQLAPADRLHALLNQPVDHDVAALAGIPHPPKPAAKEIADSRKA